MSANITRCPYARQIDKSTLHAFTCRFNVGRYLRHHAICDVVKRAIDTTRFPSIMEPVGLCLKNFKWPGGVTFSPFSGGKYICSGTLHASTRLLPAKLIRSALHPDQDNLDAMRYIFFFGGKLFLKLQYFFVVIVCLNAE